MAVAVRLVLLLAVTESVSSATTVAIAEDVALAALRFCSVDIAAVNSIVD